MTKRSSGPKTAAELMAELEADPEYVAERQRREAELQRKAEEWRRAEAPLAAELRDAGFDVDSAWDLVNTSTPYPEALPILLEHLERPYPDRVREGIARALAVRDAEFGAGVLIRLYREEPTGTDAKDGLAVAIGEAANDEVIDEVIELAGDPAQGTSRVLLLDALARSDAPRARAALEALAEDSAIGQEARALLHRGR
jgi:hypothetical protein